MENVKLDLIPGRVMPICHASQYDVGRVIRFNLVENDVPYVLDGTETVTFGERKIDGNVVTAACVVTASKSYVDLETTEQMCACYGQNLCELKIEKGSDIIGTLNFVLDVERDPLEGGIQSQSEIYNLQVQVNEIIQQELENYDIYGAYVTEQTSGAVANFTDGADDVPVKALSVEFAASQASGTPTPSSPIPITPVNSVAVTRTGKNLIPYPYYTPDGTYSGVPFSTASDGKITASGQTTAGLNYSLFRYKKVKAGTYTVSITGNHTGVQIVVYDRDTTSVIGTIASGSTDAYKTFTLAGDVENLDLYFNTGITGATVNLSCYVQLEVGSTATAYEAYNGTTALINLGGTYYGGSVDKDGNITVTAKKLTITDQSDIRIASNENGFLFYVSTGESLIKNDKQFTNMGLTYYSQAGSLYSRESGFVIYASGVFYFKFDNATNTVDLAKAVLANNPLEGWTEVATPATAQASNAIELNTLLGDNNIFSDAGDIDVTYRADTALYIDKRLNA